MRALAALRVDLVPVPLVDTVWAQITYGIEHACRKSGGDLTSDYLWSEARAGQAYLIAVTDGERIIGASVFRFEKWSSGRKFRCLAAYGERFVEWSEQAEQLARAIAKAGGATAIVTDGRAGWARRYPSARILRQTYEMDI